MINIVWRVMHRFMETNKWSVLEVLAEISLCIFGWLLNELNQLIIHSIKLNEMPCLYLESSNACNASSSSLIRHCSLCLHIWQFAFRLFSWLTRYWWLISHCGKRADIKGSAELCADNPLICTRSGQARIDQGCDMNTCTTVGWAFHPMR